MTAMGTKGRTDLMNALVVSAAEKGFRRCRWFPAGMKRRLSACGSAFTWNNQVKTIDICYLPDNSVSYQGD
jgi:hypothetical protein